MLRFVAIVIALQLASFAAESTAQTRAPAHGSLQVGIRIASARTTQEAYAKFQASLDTAMRSSSRPRDWALAAIATPHPERTLGAPSPRDDGDLFRAQQAAPGDALVQWLVANNADRSTPSGEAHVDAAIDALTRIEPDNAATWMLALDEAKKRGDAAAVDESIARMAQSRRFDDHFIDIVHAWIDVYDRHPPPPVPIAESDGGDPGFVEAFAHAAAAAMPAYQDVILACKPASGQALAPDRRAQCDKAGHLMLGRGTSLIARHIGFVVVRNVDALTDVDRAAKRDLDWYQFKGVPENASVIDWLQHEDDWRRLDDEIDVIRNRLRRNGIPDAAPEGWSPPDHPVASGAH